MKNRNLSLILMFLLGFLVIFAIMHMTSLPTGDGLLVTFEGHSHTIDLGKMDLRDIVGVRVNGKGEELEVNAKGVYVSDILALVRVSEYSGVKVVSRDSYSAEVTADEIAAEGTVCMLYEDDEARLVVFGDKDSKRSVSDVVEIIIE